MAWYDKYASGQAGMGGTQYTPEEAVGIRRMEFAQQMDEQKEQDKYSRKMARKERRRTRKGVSLMHLRRKKAARQARARGPKPAPYYQQSPVGGGNRSKLYTWDGKPIRHSQVGMSGAPQFTSLASAGYRSPTQMGFPTHMAPRGYKYSGPGGNPGSTYWKRQPARGTPGATYKDRGYGADRGTNIQWTGPSPGPSPGYTGMASWKGGGVGGGRPSGPPPLPRPGGGNIVTGPASQQQPIRTGGLDFYPAPITQWHQQQADQRLRDMQLARLEQQQRLQSIGSGQSGFPGVPPQSFDPMTEVRGPGYYAALMQQIGL